MGTVELTPRRAHESKQSSVFANRPYGRYFFSVVLNSSGSVVAPIALAFGVLEIGKSPGMLGLVLTCQVLPNAVLLLVGGVAGDRWRRNTVMVVSCLVSFVSESLIAASFLLHFSSIIFLMVFAAVNGASSAFYAPAASGVLIELVPRSDLARANSTLRIGTSSTKAIGPAVAGIVFAISGPGTLIAWDALTFLGAGVLLAGLHLPAPGSSKESFVGSLAKGWHRFRRETWLWSCTTVMAVGGMAWMAGFQLLGPVVTRDSGFSSAFWGLVVSSYAIGLIAGGFVNLHWRPRKILVAANLASVLLCIPLFGLSEGWPKIAVLGGALVAGIGTDIAMVTWAVAKQSHVPADEQARISSFDQLAAICLAPLAYPCAGFLAGAMGPKVVITGTALVIVGSSILVLLVPAVRNLGR
jgi:MFS family permease